MTMKRFFPLVIAGLLLAACNSKELGPEYTTVARFGAVSYAPAVVTSNDAVVVSVPITSEYGLQQAFLLYWLDGNTEAPVRTQPIPYLETSQAVTFSSRIPRQSVGTKVGFQVVAITHYGVWSWTDPTTYTVDSPAASDGGDGRDKETQSFILHR